jgi:hypothetical protein
MMRFIPGPILTGCVLCTLAAVALAEPVTCPTGVVPGCNIILSREPGQPNAPQRCDRSECNVVVSFTPQGKKVCAFSCAAHFRE